MTIQEKYAAALEAIEQLRFCRHGSAPAAELRPKREKLAQTVLAFVKQETKSQVMQARQYQLLLILGDHV